MRQLEYPPFSLFEAETLFGLLHTRRPGYAGSDPRNLFCFSLSPCPPFRHLCETTLIQAVVGQLSRDKYAVELTLQEVLFTVTTTPTVAWQCTENRSPDLPH
jgi:hypothetical protein